MMDCEPCNFLEIHESLTRQHKRDVQKLTSKKCDECSFTRKTEVNLKNYKQTVHRVENTEHTSEGFHVNCASAKQHINKR